MRFDSHLSRMNCRTFSTGLSARHFAGSGRRVMLAEMISPAEVVRWPLGADGRMPRLARRWEMPFSWATRALSCHYSSMGVPPGSAAQDQPGTCARRCVPRGWGHARQQSPAGSNESEGDPREPCQ